MTARYVLDLFQSRGVLDDHQLRELLDEVAATGKDIKTLLVNSGFVENEDQVYEVIAEELGAEFADLRRYEPPRAVLDLMPANLAKMHGALPVAYDEQGLHVALMEPLNPQTVEEADVFGIAQEGGQTCIQVFFFRSWQNWGNRSYYPRADRSVEHAELLASFLAQFYDDKPVPALVLLSHDVEDRELLEEALSTLAGHRIEIAVPQRGEKKSLVDHAVTNAREALGRKMAESSSQVKLLEGVQRVFGLAEMPKRIEVYDNSHIQGTNPVGAMIVAGPDGFMKSQYRKFNIRSEDIGSDDFAMMREVLTRRFTRLQKEQGERADETTAEFPSWPDLVLIDGGQGQLSAAKAVLDDLGLSTLPLAGVAKGPDRDAGREHFYTSGKASFMLEGRDPVLYYIQRLRDEAHRFAIGSHRARRSKAIGVNPLDEVPGIGPLRKKALLQAFGSAKAVARASVTGLTAVEGVSTALAQTIYDHFHEGAE